MKWISRRVPLRAIVAMGVLSLFWGLGLSSPAWAVADTVRYFHTDNLGSVTVVTDEAGAVVERMSYDAWGKRRNPDGSDDSANVVKGQSTPHGYTEHEMLDSVTLVHMNGRLYDPVVGRFVSADPNVFYPDDLQDFNRYSYVHNNPLSLTDPDGFIPYSNGVYDGGFNSSRQLSSASSINLSMLRSGIDRGLSNPSTGIFVGGGVNSSNLGMSSTPFLFSTVGSGAKTIGSYMFPSITALGDRGESGSWQDFGVGYLKQGLNTAKGMLSAFNPMLRMVPNISVSNQQLPGAATYEGAGALASLGIGPLARLGAFGSVADTAAPLALPAPTVGTVQAWRGPITAGAVPEGGMTAYRVWGGTSQQVGSWLTPIAPESSSAARSLLALPPGNTAQFLSTVEIPAGTQIQFGAAAEAFGQAGSGMQIQLLDRIPLSSFGRGTPLPP